jgi:hypothetical protein
MSGALPSWPTLGRVLHVWEPPDPSIAMPPLAALVTSADGTSFTVRAFHPFGGWDAQVVFSVATREPYTGGRLVGLPPVDYTEEARARLRMPEWRWAWPPIGRDPRVTTQPLPPERSKITALELAGKLFERFNEAAAGVPHGGLGLITEGAWNEMPEREKAPWLAVALHAMEHLK